METKADVLTQMPTGARQATEISGSRARCKNARGRVQTIEYGRVCACLERIATFQQPAFLAKSGDARIFTISREVRKSDFYRSQMFPNINHLKKK